MNDKTNMPQQQYINTPFAYTKLSKNLSLLQQQVLIKVSEHLQGYVQHYFGSDLKKSRDVPRPLFSEAEKANGIPGFFVTYAELGVAVNNYQMARAAVKEVMELTINAPGVDDEGHPSIVAYSIFSKINASTNESNGITFALNPAVVDYVFDMSQGYVRHPANIAQIGQVERMPMMYYYLFKKSERWKIREVHLTVEEIKEYFGMRRTITVGSEMNRGRPGKDADIKESYPKFSKFNKAVLEKSINDINRLKHEGLIDICVSYEPVYTGKKKVGNPAFIRFNIYDTIADLQNATVPAQQSGNLFQQPMKKAGEEELQRMKDMSTGVLADMLKPFRLYSYDGKMLRLTGTGKDIERLENNMADVRGQLRELLSQVFGKPVDLGYYKLPD
jgi:hypothetical protein